MDYYTPEPCLRLLEVRMDRLCGRAELLFPTHRRFLFLSPGRETKVKVGQ